MRSNIKCPCCGYILNKKYDATKEIGSLIAKRGPSARIYLRHILQSINKNLPSDMTRDAQFKFLQGISAANDETVKWAIDRYTDEGHLIKGRGLAYLKSMILNHSKNRKKMSKNERLTRGLSPPLIKMKG
tara:strand:+ start:273 stop:662 length:390 start_codon:yes stop_codon:yes gene_type:complete